ncbi:MAG: substrate-binding domain-containing protein [Micrococcales bacterium]|nr:substrate-binding domain-containing protein [Micrococcales bacterium]
MKTRRRARNATVATVVVAFAALAACSSGSVGDKTPATTTPTDDAVGSPTTPSGEDFSSIIPSGDIVAASKKTVSDSLGGTVGFTPSSSGPKAQQPGAHIAYVAADMTNGGINTVATHLQQAATIIDWTIDVYDGQASVQGRANACNQAIASQPAAIILGGSDPGEQSGCIQQATALHIPVLGWHEGTAAGPGNGMFTNVTTDPLTVSQLAAAYAVADSNGTAGVAIFTDSEYPIAVEKADAMKAYISACATCQVLSYNDSPIATASTDMPGKIAQLLQQYGDKLTYILAINGNYFGGAEQALRAAGLNPAGPPKGVAAGDGDAAEFQRIRTVDYQAVTVAEPLRLEAFQLIDETNRALAKGQPSEFVPQPGLITHDNVPAGNEFDPPSGYEDVYRTVWGK